VADAKKRIQVNPLELTARIEILFMAMTGKDTPIGAKEWLAREFGVSDKTVRRFCSGDRLPPPMFMLLLGYVEEHDSSERMLDEAQARRTAYYEKRGGG